MQTLGYSSETTRSAAASSWLERAVWWEKLPLVFVCGLLLGLSTPGYGISWLAWVGLVPLLLLIYGSRSLAEAALTGLCFGLSYNFLSLRWLFDLHPLNWLGFNDFVSALAVGQLWFLESLHQSLLLCLFAAFVYALPMRAGILPHYTRPYFPMLLSVPLLWMFLQWVVAPSPLYLGLPINQLAYSQASVPEVVQMANFGGAPLVDFVIVLVNATIAGFLMELTNISRALPSRADAISDRTGALFDAVMVGLLVFVLMSWGRSQFFQAAAMPPYWQNPMNADANNQPDHAKVALTAEQKAQFAPAVPVAVVQGNISIESAGKLSGEQVRDTYASLLNNLGAPLVVLPANVLGGTAAGAEPLRALLPQMAKNEKKDILVGARENVEGGIADAVRLYSPANGSNQMYQKNRLVPFAEYTPLGPLGWFVPSGLQDKITGGKAHVSHNEPRPLPGLFGNIGASLSAEILYPNLIASQVNNGAALLVNCSDLSYFRKTASILNDSMLAAAIFRAVENGRYLVLASNTGVSAVVDPHGVVTSSSMSGKGVLLDRVQFLTRRTLFTRMCMWREAALNALTLNSARKNAK